MNHEDKQGNLPLMSFSCCVPPPPPTHLHQITHSPAPSGEEVGVRRMGEDGGGEDGGVRMEGVRMEGSGGGSSNQQQRRREEREINPD